MKRNWRLVNEARWTKTKSQQIMRNPSVQTGKHRPSPHLNLNYFLLTLSSLKMALASH